MGQFSAIVVWSAVLGVKQDIAGVMLVFLSGLIRDVLLVNRLGQSSIILMVVWASAAIITSKLSRNLFSAAISALAGYLVMTLLETGRLNILELQLHQYFVIGYCNLDLERLPRIGN